MKLLVVLLLCAALAFSSVAALPYVDCAVDCGATPDVAAEVRKCTAAQATVCERCEIAVRNDQWPQFNAANTTTPETLSHCSADHANCSHVQTDMRDNYICIQYMRCSESPDMIVRVQLTGTCDAATLNLTGIASISYTGPATLVGQLPLSYPIDVYFTNITFDGNGTTESLIMDEILESNLTITDCITTNFLGRCVLKVKKSHYLAAIKLHNVYMHNLIGSAYNLLLSGKLVVHNLRHNRSKQPFIICDNCIHCEQSHVGNMTIVNVDCN